MGTALTSARTAAPRAAVLLAALGWLVTGHAVEFSLLPAIKSDLAEDSLLLDAARNGTRLLVGGEQGNILYSDDNGASWTQADVPISLAITSVAFAGDGNAWATAHDGYLLHSADNGATWEVRLTGSDVAALSVEAIEAQVQSLEAVLEQASPEAREDAEWALDDAFFALDEARAAIDGGMTSPLLETWFADDNFGYALGAYGVFLHTADGGANWVAHNNRLHNPDNYHLYGMARTAGGTLLVAGEAGTLQRSLDNGASWERIPAPYEGSYFGTVAASDGGLLVFGLRGNVFRSTDEGASWQAVDTGDQRTLMCGAGHEDGTVVLAGAAGVMLESKDAGASFEVVPTNSSIVYSGVIFDATDKVLLVGFGGAWRVGESGDE